MDSHSPRPEPTREFFTAEFKTFNEANGCWADLERIARTATMVQNGSRRRYGKNVIENASHVFHHQKVRGLK